jgi:FkbM family methyltransferase
MPRALVTYVRWLQRGRALLARCVPEAQLARIPGAARASRSVRRVLGRHLVPRRMEWVQIQNGFGKGLWTRIDLANERNWWLGKHEPEVQQELQRLVGPDAVMYDIGAHIGFHALPAARMGAQVIAFEPDPESAARLREHVERNALGSKLRIVEASVWSETRASIAFRRGLPRSQGGVGEGDHHPVLANGETIAVPACTLDEFVASGGPVPDIIKIDVEGAESEVLKGAAGILREQAPALLVEVHTASACAAVSEILTSAGYVSAWIIPPEGFPRQCFSSCPRRSANPEPTARRR